MHSARGPRLLPLVLVDVLQTDPTGHRPRLPRYAVMADIALVGSGYLTKLLVILLWFNQVIAVGEVLMLGQAGGLRPAHLRKALLCGPASSAFVHDVVPSLLAGDRLAEFGLDRIVEELASLEDFEDRNRIPARMTSLVASLHRETLARFGPINGELLAISHLEQLSGRHLGDHADATPGRPGRADG